MGSIEEDIEIVKELLKGAKEYGQYNGNQYFYSIENILSDYTRQKQINQENQNINGELRERVKELEEENKNLKAQHIFTRNNNATDKEKA